MKIIKGMLRIVIVIFMLISHGQVLLADQYIRHDVELASDLIVSGKLDELTKKFDKQLALSVTTSDLKKLIDEYVEKHGQIKTVLEIRSLPSIKVHPTYPIEETWVVSFSTARSNYIDLVLTYNKKRKINGIWLVENPDARKSHVKNVSYKNRTRLSLPFDGEWTVVQGGFLKVENHHLQSLPLSDGTAFAYDFVKLNDRNSSHDAGGRELSNYFSFGAPVLAPAGGRVVQVVNGIPDTPIDQQNWFHAAGNIVTIEHGNAEYSLIAHFKNGTISVKVGDTVKMGQVIGLCGSSGGAMGSVPHIHYQLMESPDLWKASGLPATFSNITINGKQHERAFLNKGDVVRN